MELFQVLEDVSLLMYKCLTLHFQEDTTVAEAGFAWNPDPKKSQIQITEQSPDIEMYYPQIVYMLNPGGAVEIGFGQSGGLSHDTDTKGNPYWIFGGQQDLAIGFVIRVRSTKDRKRLGDLLIRAVVRKIRPTMESNGIYYKNAFTFNGFGQQPLTDAKTILYTASLTLPVRVSWRDFDSITPYARVNDYDVDATAEIQVEEEVDDDE